MVRRLRGHGGLAGLLAALDRGALPNGERPPRRGATALPRLRCLEDLVRSGTVALVARIDPVPAHSAGFDFESMVVQLLKRHLPPDRLDRLFLDVFGTDLLTQLNGHDSLFSFVVQGERGDRLLGRVADVVERRPELVGRFDVLYPYYQRLDGLVGDWRGRPGHERLARTLVRLSEPPSAPLDTASRYQLERLRRFLGSGR